MKLQLSWKHLASFDSESEYEAFLLSRHKYAVGPTDLLIDCSLCTLNCDHQMRVLEVKCAEAICNRKCGVRYLVKKCLKNSLTQYVVEALNEHDEHFQRYKQQQREATILKENIALLSLPKALRERTEECLQRANMSNPQKILVELNNDETIDVKPNLEQIQNYLKYRRLKLSEMDNMSGVNEFISSKRMFAASSSPTFAKDNLASMADDESIYFGEELGDGSDANRFHIGITSKKLLANLANKSVTFHIDCTYKIIRYSFPLIVFGLVDQKRKFHLVAMMITSHEGEEDFVHFFTTLAHGAHSFQHELAPDYIVLDAS